MSGAIVAHNLRKEFRGTVVLDDVDVVVQAGEIVALIGANGAGKTTLLRILATTLLPDAGEASIAGCDIRSQAEAVRGSVGLLLGDERSWYWRLTGRENLEFFGALYGLSPAQAAARCELLLAEQGLDHAADRRVSAYSTGMRLRLAMARALLPSPSVLLLDEPTRSLDPAATGAFRERLATLASKRDIAVLVATHDMEDAREFSDRTVLLEAGRVVSSTGTTSVDSLVGHLSRPGAG